MKNSTLALVAALLLVAGWRQSDVNGHGAVSGPAPTISACGAGASVLGSDEAGVVTPGSGSPTSCTITFNRSYVLRPPACVVSVGASSIGPALTIDDTTDATKLVVNAASGLAGDTPIHFICVGRVW